MKTHTYSTPELRERAIGALRSGLSVNTVAKSYQVDRSTVYRWRVRYEQDSTEGLYRVPGSGRPPAFSESELEHLYQIILQPATDFGYETDFWTCRRMIQVTEKELSKCVSQPTMWRLLRSLDLTYQKPERIYHEGSDEARREWIQVEVPRIRAEVKKYRAILYFEDESNISLTAALGKTWSPRGKRRETKVTGARGGVSAMSAISQSGHLAFTLLENRIRSEEVIHFLSEMLRQHPRRHLVVVMDQASPHTSKKTKGFIESQKRLHVFYLPKYSPNFNPDEYVWNHLKHQELKCHQARSKEELMALAEIKLEGMSKNPHLMRGLWFRCCVADLMN